jgi:uncharacterized protein
MKFFKKRSTALTFLALIIVSMFFYGRSSAAKIPTNEDDVTILPSGSYVQDRAGVISDKTEEYITKMNNDLYSQCSGEIQIATVDKLDDIDLEGLANKIGEESDLSYNSCVFVLSVEDVDAAIVASRGISNELDDDSIVRILQTNFIDEDFKNRDLEKGIRKTFDDVISVYEEKYGIAVNGRDNIVIPRESDGEDYFSLMIGLVFIVLLIILVTVSLTRSRRRRYYRRYGGYYGGGRRRTSSRSGGWSSGSSGSYSSRSGSGWSSGSSGSYSSRSGSGWSSGSSGSFSSHSGGGFSSGSHGSFSSHSGGGFSSGSHGSFKK